MHLLIAIDLFLVELSHRLLQYMPQNKVIQALAQGGRQGFVEHESQSRHDTQMPPFARLAALILSGIHAQEVLNVAKLLVKKAPFDKNVMVLGPVEAPIFLLRGKYRYRLLVKAPSNINIQKWLSQWLTMFKIPRAVNIKVDIDPYSFM